VESELTKSASNQHGDEGGSDGWRALARPAHLPASEGLPDPHVCDTAPSERSYDRARQILDLEHYLDVLERKPGALRGSKPLAEWRAEGRWRRAMTLYGN
jgi:hypothetical protein